MGPAELTWVPSVRCWRIVHNKDTREILTYTREVLGVAVEVHCTVLQKWQSHTINVLSWNVAILTCLKYLLWNIFLLFSSLLATAIPYICGYAKRMKSCITDTHTHTHTLASYPGFPMFSTVSWDIEKYEKAWIRGYTHTHTHTHTHTQFNMKVPYLHTSCEYDQFIPLTHLHKKISSIITNTALAHLISKLCLWNGWTVHTRERKKSTWGRLWTKNRTGWFSIFT